MTSWRCPDEVGDCHTSQAAWWLRFQDEHRAHKGKPHDQCRAKTRALRRLQGSLRLAIGGRGDEYLDNSRYRGSAAAGGGAIMAVPWNGVLQVGAGRGFVVEATCGPFGGKARIVVTAGHCLGLVLPPSHAASYTEERTYRSILGPLGGPTEVRAECLFVDPITDIAVLAAPDYEALAEEADAYERLVAGMAPFPVADAPQEDIKKAQPGRGLALVLSLNGNWVECTVERRGHWLWVKNTGMIEGGMSGSPIIAPTGQAIGVVSTGSMSAGLTMHPVLVEVLPRRIGLSSI